MTMVLLIQTLIGSALLLGCTLGHILAVVASIPVLRHLGHRYQNQVMKRTFVVFSATVLILLASHSVQVWAWAALFLITGDMPDLATSLYFSTVTYTTLGYGDIVLEDQSRFVATFGAVTGLISFGITTAFLIGVLSRLLPEVFGSK